MRLGDGKLRPSFLDITPDELGLTIENCVWAPVTEYNLAFTAVPESGLGCAILEDPTLFLQGPCGVDTTASIFHTVKLRCRAFLLAKYASATDKQNAPENELGKNPVLAELRSELRQAPV